MQGFRSARIAWLVPAVLLLTACAARPAPSPQAPSDQTPSDAAPADPASTPGHVAEPADEAPPDVPEVPCLSPAEASGLPLGRYEFNAVTEGLCTAVAPVEDFYVFFQFPPGLPEDAIRSAVEVSGGEVKQLDLYSGQYLTLRLGPGEPGTVTTVRVSGPVGEGGAQADLGFRLRREPSPTVAVEVQVRGGVWRPHEPGEYLSGGPVRVRLRFSYPVSANQVEDRFEEVLGARKDREAVPYQLSWTDPQTLLVEVPEPPPTVFVDLSWIMDDRGLHTLSGVLNIHTGTQPRLAVLDPATGREEVLGLAPFDILWSAASPDGRWVVLEATHPAGTSDVDVWLVDTAAGQAIKTDLAASPYAPGYYWFPDRLVVAGWEKLQEWDLTRHEGRVLPAKASYAGPLSPDGRYLAGRVLHMDREDPETWLAPLTVAVYDLTTHTERLYPEVGNFRVPHSDAGPVSVPMRWADDGRSLYVLQHAETSTPAEPRSYWAVLDLSSGRLTRAMEVPADIGAAFEPQPLTSATGWAYRSTGWGNVTLLSPDGQAVTHGEGLPLTWLPDGRLLLVRWPDYQYLRYPGL